MAVVDCHRGMGIPPNQSRPKREKAKKMDQKVS